VLADSGPGVATFAVLVVVAAKLWWGRDNRGCGADGGAADHILELDANVVDADCGEGVATLAIVISHTSDGRRSRRDGRRRRGFDGVRVRSRRRS
jgi:hypothetical protein